MAVFKIEFDEGTTNHDILKRLAKDGVPSRATIDILIDDIWESLPKDCGSPKKPDVIGYGAYVMFWSAKKLQYRAAVREQLIKRNISFIETK